MSSRKHGARSGVRNLDVAARSGRAMSSKLARQRRKGMPGGINFNRVALRVAVLSTGRVTLKLVIAGLLLGGGCVAQQNWEFGGGAGYGAYHNGTITSTGGTADAGFKNAAV